MKNNLKIFAFKYHKCIFSIFIIVILCVSLLIKFLLCNYISTGITTSPKTNLTIVIDPGHGGIDPGSVGRKTKITEQELNLKIALKLKDFLEASETKVVLTRNDENGLYGIYDKGYKLRDMRVRRDIIQNSNADLVVSIHMNSFTNSKYRGAQVFFDSTSPTSEKFALAVQNCFAKDLPESDRGISVGDYYILKCTSIPSILCECGYLSNEKDEELLVTDDHQLKIAYAIFKGIVSYISSNNN